jgi:hypothetical protein
MGWIQQPHPLFPVIQRLDRELSRLRYRFLSLERGRALSLRKRLVERNPRELQIPMISELFAALGGIGNQQTLERCRTRLLEMSSLHHTPFYSVRDRWEATRAALIAAAQRGHLGLVDALWGRTPEGDEQRELKGMIGKVAAYREDIPMIRWLCRNREAVEQEVRSGRMTEMLQIGWDRRSEGVWEALLDLLKEHQLIKGSWVEQETPERRPLRDKVKELFPLKEEFRREGYGYPVVLGTVCSLEVPPFSFVPSWNREEFKVMIFIKSNQPR